MPYINKEARAFLRRGDMSPRSPGELNYVITKLVGLYLTHRGGVSYINLNEAIGVLECAKLELYRRVAAPYEDVKREQNGDVYS